MDMKTIKFGLLVLATAASTLFGHQASAQFQGHIGVHPGFGGPGFGHDNGFGHDPGFDDGFGHDHGYIDYNEARRLSTLLYRGILGRSPDQGGHQMTIQMIMDGQIMQRAVDMGNSPEFRNRVRQVGAREAVRTMYRVFFSRNPDQGAMEWVYQIQQGYPGEAVYGIVASDEFAEKQLW